MLEATRRWFRRNRTPLAVGVGVVGAGYVVTQYVLGKINDARERMGSDRIAKENLRRRFEQNQEDCTFTVLALLPSATTNILEAMNTEKITYEIQKMKGQIKSLKAGDSVSPPSIADTTMTEDDGRSMVSSSVQSESGVHASMVTVPGATSAPTGGAEGGMSQDGGAAAAVAAQKSKRSKRQLWDDLTISSITRAFTLLYTLALLTMLTRVQLNLLGRRSYLSSVITLATGTAQATISLENNDDDGLDQPYGNDFETNRRYLTFSWWLLNEGWKELGQRVEAAVRQVFGHLSPRDLLSFEQFSELTLAVRKIVEGATPEERRAAKWLLYLLPPRDREDHVLRESGILEESIVVLSESTTSQSPSSSPAVRRLLDETSDLIESPSFTHVLTLILDAGFSLLVDKKLASAAFDKPDLSESEPRTSQVVLLPKILSVLTRQAHAIGNGMPNEYLQEMEQVADLEGFAAVVYSSNWANEIHDDEGGIMASAVDIRASQGTTTATNIPSQTQGTTQGTGEDSVIMVNPATSFESAWGRAVDRS
ncbi:Peroxisomal biogenesis factor 3 [Colletotrichum tanaceti]|uniref:Peroxisomal biogenesis factor 3 n=1 Tax=Colletotrichum tanaceti TaxID=1306861 RepID=A0A4U6XP14_9PEZI|nr:Peroxisomal biogenesis factor 3 [Colletotrichum tanaceti]TKW57523.1 Peroxisomal biogenesis factor 3 [Colletotrichum tanaceti]